MRVSLLWKGKPLVGIDVQAQSPDDDDADGPTLRARGSLEDSTIAEPKLPETTVLGFSAMTTRNA